MKSRIIRVSFFSVISCILLSLFCTELTYAVTQIQWNRQGVGEITCGVTESERDFCGGVEGYVVAMTQTDYTTHRYQDYAYCPGKYDLVLGITFETPSSPIVGQASIRLKANGTQTGTRDCCFIGDWFKYSVSCDGSGAELYPVGSDDEKKTVDLMDSVNDVVNISDDLDIYLHLPGSTSTAKECVITGWTSGGCSISWTYKRFVLWVEQLFIDRIVGPTSVKCSDTAVNGFTVVLENYTFDHDTKGIVGLTHNAVSRYNAPIVTPTEQSYNVPAATISDGMRSRDYSFEVKFPSNMFSGTYRLTAAALSDSNTTVKYKDKEIYVDCLERKKSSLDFLMLLLLGK